MHSTHFIYGYMASDHSDSERGNLLLPHGLLFPISSKGFFYIPQTTDRITHTMAFVTPVMEHWLELVIKCPTTVYLVSKPMEFIW